LESLRDFNLGPLSFYVKCTIAKVGAIGVLSRTAPNYECPVPAIADEDEGGTIMPKPVDLERLIAQQEIRDLCCRYARGADRVDVGVFTSVFWEDGGYSQLYSDESIARIAEETIGFMGKNFSCTQHLNCNILVDFVDEDHATTEVYFRAFHLTKADLKSDEVLPLVGARRFAELSHVDGNVYEIVVGGRYLDHVERRDGVWKIKTRRLIFDYSTVRHSSTLLAGEGMTAFAAAKMARDQSDPSYSK
jgi:hypothetical protein